MAVRQKRHCSGQTCPQPESKSAQNCLWLTGVSPGKEVVISCEIIGTDCPGRGEESVMEECIHLLFRVCFSGTRQA